MDNTIEYDTLERHQVPFDVECLLVGALGITGTLDQLLEDAFRLSANWPG